MHKAQCIELLKTLNTKELRKCRSYLQSKYHNANEEVVNLFLYLKQYGPIYDSSRLDKAKICRVLFPAQKVSYAKINKLAHLLKTQLEQFIIQCELEQDQVAKDRLLVRALEKRNHPNYAKSSKQLIQIITNQPSSQQNAQNYFDLFQLNYTLWSNINTAKNSENFPLFEAASQYIDSFYLLNKLKIILEYYTSKAIVTSSIRIFRPAELQNLQAYYPTLQQDKNINLLFDAIQLIESGAEEDFYNLKRSLVQIIHQLSKKDAQSILLILTNHCNKKLAQQPQKFAQEQFVLLQFAEEHDLLTEHGRIRDVEYTNTASVGFYTQNMEWTLNFIKAYRPYLAEAIRATTYIYVQALYHFYQKEYSDVNKLLRTIEIADKLTLGMDIKIRTLSLRAFYEEWQLNKTPLYEEQQFLLKRIKSFESQIKDHPKLPVNKKEEYGQFTFLLHKLALLHQVGKQSASKLANVQQLYEKTPSVALRTWLGEKIQEARENLSLPK